MTPASRGPSHIHRASTSTASSPSSASAISAAVKGQKHAAECETAALKLLLSFVRLDHSQCCQILVSGDSAFSFAEQLFPRLASSMASVMPVCASSHSHQQEQTRTHAQRDNLHVFFADDQLLLLRLDLLESILSQVSRKNGGRSTREQHVHFSGRSLRELCAAEEVRLTILIWLLDMQCSAEEMRLSLDAQRAGLASLITTLGMKKAAAGHSSPSSLPPSSPSSAPASPSNSPLLEALYRCALLLDNAYFDAESLAEMTHRHASCESVAEDAEAEAEAGLVSAPPTASTAAARSASSSSSSSSSSGSSSDSGSSARVGGSAAAAPSASSEFRAGARAFRRLLLRSVSVRAQEAWADPLLLAALRVLEQWLAMTLIPPAPRTSSSAPSASKPSSSPSAGAEAEARTALVPFSRAEMRAFAEAALAFLAGGVSASDKGDEFVQLQVSVGAGVGVGVGMGVGRALLDGRLGCPRRVHARVHLGLKRTPENLSFFLLLSFLLSDRFCGC